MHHQNQVGNCGEEPLLGILPLHKMFGQKKILCTQPAIQPAEQAIINMSIKYIAKICEY
jgi:hypothetical protein